MEYFDFIISVLTLTILEIVLGIDNLVFLSILTDKLPMSERARARYWGLTFAWVTRLILLASTVYLASLSKPFLIIGDIAFSVRSLILFLGGAFLIAKATQEIHIEMGLDEIKTKTTKRGVASLKRVVIQIALMDIIFSLDSVLTAIGLTSNFVVMALAITFAILIMIYASQSVGEFIEKHPTIKMLALSFLILIGTLLVADSFSFHVPRGYLYFAMGFSFAVESLNLMKRARRKKKKRDNDAGY